MTETTMQGEKKKKIDEKQTRDRKNVITIFLMLAIATTGTKNSFISTIKRDYDFVETFLCVFYTITHTHTQIAHKRSHHDRYGKFVCKQDQSRRVRRSRFHRRGVRFHRLFRVLHDRAVDMYSKRKCEEITDSKAVENKWI